MFTYLSFISTVFVLVLGPFVLNSTRFFCVIHSGSTTNKQDGVLSTRSRTWTWRTRPQPLKRQQPLAWGRCSDEESGREHQRSGRNDSRYQRFRAVLRRLHSRSRHLLQARMEHHRSDLYFLLLGSRADYDAQHHEGCLAGEWINGFPSFTSEV